MFAIITNYKKLTLSLFKSEFAGENPGDTLSIDDFNRDEPGSDLKALRKALKDGKIDSNEAKIISEQINEISDEAKEGLKEVANSLLKDGFSTMTKSSYDSFVNIMNLSGENIKMPTWSSLENITKESFNDLLGFNKSEFILDRGFKSDDFHGIKITKDNIFIQYDGIGNKDTLVLIMNDEGAKVKGWESRDGEENNIVESKINTSMLDDNIEKADGILNSKEQAEAISLISGIKLLVENKNYDVRFNRIIKDSIIKGIDGIPTSDASKLKKSDLSYLKKLSVKVVEVEQKSNIITKNIEPKDLPKNLEKFKSLSDKVVYTLLEGDKKTSVTGKITKLTSYKNGDKKDYKVTINNKEYILDGNTNISTNNGIESTKENNKIDSNKKTIEWNKKRYSNKEVIAIQLALGIDSDGKFGPNTLSAVKKFQSDNNLKVDGKIGKMTLKRLGVDFKKKEVTNDSFKAEVIDKNDKESGSKNIVTTYEDFRGNVKEITVEKIDFTDDNNQEKSKYKVELEDSTGLFHNDIEWTFDHSPTKADIQSVVDKFNKVENDKEEVQVMVGKLKFKPSEVKELEALGIDYEEIVADKEYQLDRKGLWSNDFKISVNKDSKFIVKDTDGRIELTVDGKLSLTETLVKVDKLLPLISDIERRLTPDDNEYTQDETELKLKDGGIIKLDNNGELKLNNNDLNNLDITINKLEYALMSDSEKEEKKNYEDLGISESQAKKLSENGLDPSDIRLIEEGKYELDIDGTDNGYLIIEGNKITDEKGLIDITIDPSIKSSNIVEIVGLMKILQKKTNDTNYNLETGENEFSKESILIKKYLELNNPIKSIKDLAIIKDISKMEEINNTKINKEKKAEKDFSEKLNNNPLLGDIDIKIPKGKDKDGNAFEGEYYDKTFKLEFKIDGDELILDTKWNQPGSDTEVVFIKDEFMNDDASFVDKRNKLITDYKEKVANTKKIEKDAFGRPIDDEEF